MSSTTIKGSQKWAWRSNFFCMHTVWSPYMYTLIISIFHLYRYSTCTGMSLQALCCDLGTWNGSNLFCHYFLCEIPNVDIIPLDESRLLERIFKTPFFMDISIGEKGFIDIFFPGLPFFFALVHFLSSPASIWILYPECHNYFYSETPQCGQYNYPECHQFLYSHSETPQDGQILLWM